MENTRKELAGPEDSVPTLTVGVPKEVAPGEGRVALVPGVLPLLAKARVGVVVQAGAGEAAGIDDASYVSKGARVGDLDQVFHCDVVATVQATALALPKPRSATDAGGSPAVAGLCAALSAPPALARLAETRATVFALELMPRITRAQSMDVLSSQATVAGYKAVLLAADTLPRMFPLMTTAAGTIAPARVLVIGAGVAGLQAIATARRLGAVVEAYDVRPAAREQVQSLGAKFVELPLEAEGAEDRGGYARELGEDFYKRQAELLARVVGASDVVITTAQVPGKRAPVLVTAAMVAGMSPGSVVVDIAAEQGGNCEVTRAGETVVTNGVRVLGPTNIAASVPYDASQMYAKNMAAFLLHLVHEGRLTVDRDDEITRETLVAEGGEIVNPRVREAFGMGTQPTEAAPAKVTS